MKELKTGDRVKMSQNFINANLINPNCSDHIKEFCNCEGVVEDRMFYPSMPDFVAPEWNVRWEPSGLKYAYLPSELVKAKKK